MQQRNPGTSTGRGRPVYSILSWKKNFGVTSSFERARKHDICQESLDPATESDSSMFAITHRLKNFHFATTALKTSTSQHARHLSGSINYHGRSHSSSGIQIYKHFPSRPVQQHVLPALPSGSRAPFSLRASDSLKARQVDGDTEGRELSVTHPRKGISLDLHVTWLKHRGGNKRHLLLQLKSENERRAAHQAAQNLDACSLSSAWKLWELMNKS